MDESGVPLAEEVQVHILLYSKLAYNLNITACQPRLKHLLYALELVKRSQAQVAEPRRPLSCLTKQDFLETSREERDQLMKSVVLLKDLNVESVSFPR